MKVIDNPKVSEKPSSPGKLDTMLGSLGLGRNLPPEQQAQEDLIAHLEKALDNRFVMLRNVTLEGLELPIPMVLVGPPGVRVIYPHAARGVFQVKGEVLEYMDDRYQTYRTVTPNLLTRAKLMAQAVTEFINARHPAPVEAEPVLFFSDPGTHVDSVRPVVRIVQADGLDHLAAGLLQSRVYLEKDEVQKVVDYFLTSMGISERQLSPFPERDAFSFADDTGPDKPSLADRLPRGEGLVSTLNKIPFSRRQWYLLGCMVVVNIIVLIAFVVLVLLTS